LRTRRSFAAVCDELDRRRQVTLGFERIERLLELLDHPARALEVVQVVGTNGKGTTSVALAAALEAGGHPSGAYLSPHVLSYTERVMIGGRYVSEEEFARGMGEVIQVADEDEVPASQFELLTAGALAMFRDAGLSWAVMEAGLGARHDATSAAKPRAVVLTNVALDHTEYLGETVEQIAREKLARLPDGGLLVLGTDDPRVVDVARKECARARAELVEVKGTSATSGGSVPPYVERNVAVALRAAEALLGRELDAAVRDRSFHAVDGTLPARFEEHEVAGVPVVVDGGHNPAGLKAALEATKARYEGRPLAVVFGVLRDKDIGSMLTVLDGGVQTLVLTRPMSERAVEPDSVVRGHGLERYKGRWVRVVANVEDALDGAVREMRKAGGVVLVTGSLYLGTAILGWLRER
jgi:dihydrofolate synthase/folylpolyglutamate synthase